MKQETHSGTRFIAPIPRLTTFIHASVFVLGFSLVFTFGWGGAATAVGQLFGQYKILLGQVGGVIVILFGLASLGVLHIPWMNYEIRPGWKFRRGNSLVSSGLMGVFFAAGWTPCVGPTLGAILTLGYNSQTATQAMFLASGYALGLGIPFLLLGLGMERALNILKRFRRYQHTFQIASGVLLILMGLLLLTGRMSLIAIWAQSNGYFLDLPLYSAAAPTYAIAVFAGLLSFLSPCILPLVPAYLGYLSGRSSLTGTA